MIHLGDITKINGAMAPVVDCIIGGSPCQDLSVAGKRAGLDGERSGLFMEQIRLIKEMRENDRMAGRADIDVRPRYMVWENVPGAFSSNGGEDFRIVLEETAKVADKDAVIPRPTDGKWKAAGCIVADGWSIAWRVLDAQFWGVPQRRRRIALVADFGGQSAPEILFVRKSVSGDTEQGRTQGKDTAGHPSVGTGADDCERYPLVLESNPNHATITDNGICPTLNASMGLGGGYVPMVCKANGSYGGDTSFAVVGGHENSTTDMTNLVVSLDRAAYNQGQNAQFDIGVSEDGVAQTVIAKGPCAVDYSVDMGGGKSSCVVEKDKSPKLTCTHYGEPAVAYGISSYDSNAMKSSNPNSGIYEADTSRTLDLNGGNPSCNQGGIAVVQAVDFRNGTIDDTNGCLQSSSYHDLNANNVVLYANAPYQSKTGSLMANSHPGGVTGQDAVSYPATYAMQAIGQYEDSDKASALKMRDYKDATDLVVAKEAYAYPMVGDNSVGTLDAHYAQMPGCRGGIERTMVYQNTGIRYIVRRLTPLERTRLQGYPDEHLNIGDWTDSNGKLHKESDSVKYKALGNSIALPPWKWVLKRICACYERDATMASLFDGIGGFPLIWEQINGKGSCLWASEIEEFPIAVTKERFK